VIGGETNGGERVFFFGGGKAEGNGTMKDVLGGKGAGLAEMTNLGVPVPRDSPSAPRRATCITGTGKAPPGGQDGGRGEPREARAAIGKKLGDPKNPLLVSVRSGAKFSMPA